MQADKVQAAVDKVARVVIINKVIMRRRRRRRQRRRRKKFAHLPQLPPFLLLLRLLHFRLVYFFSPFLLYVLPSKILLLKCKIENGRDVRKGRAQRGRGKAHAYE